MNSDVLSPKIFWTVKGKRLFADSQSAKAFLVILKHEGEFK
tara:strand:+ start:379 stop:501 length:123 start_codon:yes stop_codon:yes gene_type:complete